jgi:hypothetical protein
MLVLVLMLLLIVSEGNGPNRFSRPFLSYLLMGIIDRYFG